MRLLLSLALTLTLLGCRSGTAPAPDTPLPATSLYALDVTWTTQDAEPLAWDAFRGQPVVVAMVYAHCAYACPLIVNDMRRIAEALPERAGVRYLLVSLDPERDTPEQLRAFRDGFGLGDDWTLLRGDPRDVRRLAALLGVRYKREADGQISHSNTITVLDPQGRIAMQQEGLGTEPTEAVGTLRALIARR